MKPFNVIPRQFRRACSTIASKRGCSTIFNPVTHEIAAFDSGQSEGFMVAHQKSRLVETLRLETHKKFDHAPAVGSSVNVVTDEDEPHRSSSRVEAAFFHESAQLT